MNFKDVIGMLYRLELTHDETEDILEKNYFAASSTRYTLPPGSYEISDIILMLKFSLPGEVKVKISIYVIRLRSKLTITKTKKFTGMSFLLHNHMLHSFTLMSSEKSPKKTTEKVAGTYKNDKPINNTGIHKIHIKCDCADASIRNGVREPTLLSFALAKSPEQKTYKELRIKHF